MQVTAVGRLGPTADSDLTIDFGSETMALFLHDVHMLEISPEQNPAQNPQPLLYQTAKQQEEQLKYSLANVPMNNQISHSKYNYNSLKNLFLVGHT